MISHLLHLRVCVHNSLCAHGLVFLREDLGRELLHHRASICLVFVGKYNLFSKELFDFTPSSNVQISSSVFFTVFFSYQHFSFCCANMQS